MKITGQIKVIRESNRVSEKFVKREFVLLDDSGMYPQELIMEFIQDKVSVLDQYAEGDRVTVDINLLGRMWTNPQGEDKYFITLQAWRIEASSQEGNNQEANVPDLPISDDEDLPF